MNAATFFLLLALSSAALASSASDDLIRQLSGQAAKSNEELAGVISQANTVFHEINSAKGKSAGYEALQSASFFSAVCALKADDTENVQLLCDVRMSLFMLVLAVSSRTQITDEQRLSALQCQANLVLICSNEIHLLRKAGVKEGDAGFYNVGTLGVTEEIKKKFAEQALKTRIANNMVSLIGVRNRAFAQLWDYLRSIEAFAELNARKTFFLQLGFTSDILAELLESLSPREKAKDQQPTR